MLNKEAILYRKCAKTLFGQGLESSKITFSYFVFGCFVNNQSQSTDTTNRFYFMLYDLCMRFWIEKIGYNGKIRKMVDSF